MSIELKQGDALAVLKTMESESVQCAITSPPYWGLRDYGTATWQGGDAGCDHVNPNGMGNTPSTKSTLTTNNGAGPKAGDKFSADAPKGQYRDTCGKCGAVRIDAQIGLESTPEEYVAHIVAVMREVWRVLRDDGTLWLVLGDSYCSTAPGTRNSSDDFGGRSKNPEQVANMRPVTPNGLKPKDLVGIPWRVAFALQADGWYLRSDIIWSKPNPMPESVTDRPTKAHEYIFLLSKQARYYYDAETIKEPLANGTAERYAYGFNAPAKKQEIVETGKWHTGKNGRDNLQGDMQLGTGRNRRTVWTIPTSPYKGAHFATFPPKLIEPMVLAACPVGGIVLDPFMGSGTVGAVCVQYNRNFIGIELNPKYIELARERITKAQSRDPRYLRECGMSLSEIAKTLKVTVPEVARQLK